MRLLSDINRVAAWERIGAWVGVSISGSVTCCYVNLGGVCPYQWGLRALSERWFQRILGEISDLSDSVVPRDAVYGTPDDKEIVTDE